MPPRKKASPPASPKPIPAPAKTEVDARPKLTPAELAQKARELLGRHQTAPLDPRGAREAKPDATVVELRLTLSDGTVILAEGEHASVIHSYTEECQLLCLQHGFATYTGPDMHRFTAAQWAARSEGVS